MTPEHIRREIGCTRRHVQKVLKAEREQLPSRQMKLI